MSIFNKATKTFQWGQNKVTMETGEIARQSTGAVLLDMDGSWCWPPWLPKPKARRARISSR